MLTVRLLTDQNFLGMEGVDPENCLVWVVTGFSNVQDKFPVSQLIPHQVPTDLMGRAAALRCCVRDAEMMSENRQQPEALQAPPRFVEFCVCCCFNCPVSRLSDTFVLGQCF